MKRDGSGEDLGRVKIFLTILFGTKSARTDFLLSRLSLLRGLPRDVGLILFEEITGNKILLANADVMNPRIDKECVYFKKLKY